MKNPAEGRDRGWIPSAIYSHCLRMISYQACASPRSAVLRVQVAQLRSSAQDAADAAADGAADAHAAGAEQAQLEADKSAGRALALAVTDPSYSS